MSERGVGCARLLKTTVNMIKPSRVKFFFDGLLNQVELCHVGRIHCLLAVDTIDGKMHSSLDISPLAFVS